MKCVDEKGTMKVRVNLSHKSSFPAFSSPSARKSHRCTWMAPKKKSQYEKMLGLSFHKYTFGKRTKVPLEVLNFLLPRVGRKALWKFLLVLKSCQPCYLPTSHKQMKLPYYTALPYFNRNVVQSIVLSTRTSNERCCQGRYHKIFDLVYKDFSSLTT